MQEVLKSCNPEKTTFLLTHYSFDFLDRSEQEIVVALLRDYNVRLWLAGHEHTNLARKQRDYFYEFQCGNLLLENGARSCVLIGELDTHTLTGQIQVHAWFSPDGWATYPFACIGNSQPSIYPFNLIDAVKNTRASSQSQQEILRQKLHTTITPILLENQRIFETYGSTSINRDAMRSELSAMWDKMLIAKILPNSFEIISMLDAHQFLLSGDEICIVEKYKMHVMGLKENHSGTGQFLLDAPLFPVEILSILK